MNTYKCITTWEYSGTDSLTPSAKDKYAHEDVKDEHTAQIRLFDVQVRRELNAGDVAFQANEWQAMLFPNCLLQQEAWMEEGFLLSLLVHEPPARPSFPSLQLSRMPTLCSFAPKYPLLKGAGWDKYFKKKIHVVHQIGAKCLHLCSSSLRNYSHHHIIFVILYILCY